MRPHGYYASSHPHRVCCARLDPIVTSRGQSDCEHVARCDSLRRYSAWEEVVVPSEPFSLPQYGLRVGQRFRTHRKPGLFRLVSESAYRSALHFA
jgi:hypothetical protein